MTDFTAFPIANVTIPSLPDLGGVTDSSMMVGERAGTGRFAVTALRDYVMTTVSAGYLPLSGGTINGGVTLTGDLAVKDTAFFNSTGMALVAGPDFSAWKMDSANWELLYNRVTGTLVYQRWDGSQLFAVDAYGNGTFNGTVHGTNVTLLEARIEELQAQVADLQETLATRIAALEARMGTGAAD